MTRHELLYVRLSTRQRVKRLLCQWFGRHLAVIATVEKFPAGIKPWKQYRCLCGFHQREKYAAQFDTELR